MAKQEEKIRIVIVKIANIFFINTFSYSLAFIELKNLKDFSSSK